MDPNAYLDNISTNLLAFSQADPRDDIQATLKFAGTPEELSKRDDVKGEVVCLRYKSGTFAVSIGSNKPSEWNPQIELMPYVETAGGIIDRDKGYKRLLDVLAVCVDWSNQVDANADIHSDLSDFFAVSNGQIIDDRPKYFAQTITFNATVCL